jgi:Fe-S-cluster containining protein
MPKHKKNKRAGKGRKALTPDQILANAKKERRKNLKEKIQTVYNSVDLETVGCEIAICKCTCCKVAMPAMNYSEFVQMATDLWQNSDAEKKTNVICKSIEYFFKNEYEKWGMESLVKPCQFVDEKGRCSVYENRPLSCRIYGLWPDKVYEDRVDKFEKAYSEFGLTREDIPLSKQCKMIRRKDGTTELSMDELDGLFGDLDKIDKSIGDFSSLQIKNKENYRTFHDWLLLKVFGEDWLSMLTTFMMSASKEQMEDQVEQLRLVIVDDLDLDNDKTEQRF